jgi:hypothetical protein
MNSQYFILRRNIWLFLSPPNRQLAEMHCKVLIKIETLLAGSFKKESRILSSPIPNLLSSMPPINHMMFLSSQMESE